MTIVIFSAPKYRINTIDYEIYNSKWGNLLKKIVDNNKYNTFLCIRVLLKSNKMSEIAQKVKSIIVDKLGVEESEVTAEASFTNDLGADSLDTVELIMEFEKEFNISIPDEQAENIQTVGQAVAYLEQNVK